MTTSGRALIMTHEQRLKALIASLDRICPACLAAIDQSTHDMLHLGKSCPTKNPSCEQETREVP